MDNKKSGGGGTHTVMSKKLAEALMEAGMQHMDLGGTISDVGHAYAGSPLTGFVGDFINRGMLGGALNNQFGNALGNGNGGLLNGGVTNGFDAANPSIVGQDFQTQITGAQQQQRDLMVQQQAMANNLLQQYGGKGPSLAQPMLAQATGQNAAMQGAMMASQRGASSNPALIARQAAQQGANVQQQSAGQAATMRAQEQMSAGQQAAQMQQSMMNQALQRESVQQGGIAALNTATTTGQLGAQNINANIQGQNAQTRGGILGGVLQGVGGGLAGGLFKNKGGIIPKMSDGGLLGIQHYDAPTDIPKLKDIEYKSNPGMGLLGQGLGGFLSKGLGTTGGSDLSSIGTGTEAGGGGGLYTAGATGAEMGMAQGGSIPTMLQGGSIPGNANVKGDSKKNDVVPTLLSPGEAVIPRSIMNAPDMEKKVIEFLRHLKGGGKAKGYGNVVQSKACGGKVK